MWLCHIARFSRPFKLCHQCFNEQVEKKPAIIFIDVAFYKISAFYIGRMQLLINSSGWVLSILIRLNGPVSINLFRVNDGNTRTKCEICSQWTIKKPERRSNVIIINFEQILHIVLVFLVLTLIK